MKFTIVIYSAPYSTQASYSAWRFAQSALSAGHQIYRIFFYCDGVHNTNVLSTPPQDEFDLVTAWETLIGDNGLDAVSCVSSALKRGVINYQEAQRYEKSCDNLSSVVQLSGLGQLVDASIMSDRVVSFGA